MIAHEEIIVQDQRPHYVSIITIGLTLLATLSTWAILLVGAGRGLDLTDESYYLMNYHRLDDVSGTFTQFGVVLQPLYDLTSTDIPLIRLAGMLILIGATALASFMTTWEVSRHRRMREGNILTPPYLFDTLSIILLVSASVSLHYWRWRTVPAYDWMALTGLLLFWTGLLLWLDWGNTSQSRGGLALLGFAAAFVFWGKATTAATLPLFVLTALWINRAHLKRLLTPQTIVWGIVGFLVGMSLPFSQGETLTTLIGKYQLGAEYQGRLWPENYQGISSIFRVQLERLIEYTGLILYSFVRGFAGWALPIALAWFLVLLERRSSRPPSVRLVEGLLTVGWLATVYWAITTFRWYSTALPFLVGTAFIFLWAYEVLTATRPVDTRAHRGIGSFVALFVLLIAYLLGTGNGYTYQANSGVVFSVMAVIVPLVTFASDENRLLRSAIVLSLSVSVFTLLYRSSLEPFRQDTSIWQMTTSTTIHNGEKTVLVGEDMARYLDAVQTLAYDHGFERGMPFIDLTGHSPGVAYVLDARAYVFPWLIGGYAGSEQATVFLLSQWQDDLLHRAWILTSLGAGTIRTIPAGDVLSEVGLDFPAGYIQVGEIQHFLDDEVQALWRPREGDKP